MLLVRLNKQMSGVRGQMKLELMLLRRNIIDCSETFLICEVVVDVGILERIGQSIKRSTFANSTKGINALYFVIPLHALSVHPCICQIC